MTTITVHGLAFDIEPDATLSPADADQARHNLEEYLNCLTADEAAALAERLKDGDITVLDHVDNDRPSLTETLAPAAWCYGMYKILTG